MMRRRPLDWGWVLGLLFAAAGVAAAGTAVVFAWGSEGAEAAGLAALAIVLGGIGTAWLVTSYRANRYTIQRNRLAREFPDEPWRWRPEWDAKRIPHSSRRFGTTVLELQILPALIGGTVSGEIVTAFRDQSSGGFTATLRSLHVYVTGVGKSRRVNQAVLWEDSRTIPVSSSSGNHLRARLEIPISEAARETNDDDPNNEIIWRLSVSADVGGRPFESVFDVPVFRG